MNTKSLIGLVVIAVVTVIAAFWATSERSPETTVTREQLLIPGLQETVNDITRMQLVKASAQPVATLERGESGWSIAEKTGYPADIGKVRELLLALADAKLLERKTANPERYAPLGVQDISAEDAPGVKVTLEGLAEPIAVIVGNQAVQTGSGTYVRRVDEAESWLASGNLTVAQATTDWLAADLLDIPAERIQRVTLRQPDGTTLEVVKETREQGNFTVRDVPADRELKSESTANSLAGTLTALSLDDVTTVEAMNPADYEGVTAEFQTFDGLTLVAKAFEAKDIRYVHFGVSADEAQAQRFAPTSEPAADEEDQASADPGGEEEETAMPRAEAAAPAGDKIDFAATQQEAERLDARLNPWVFAISQNKYDSMTRRLEDLLKPVEEPEPAAAATDQTDGSAETTGPEPAPESQEAVELDPASGPE